MALCLLQLSWIYQKRIYTLNMQQAHFYNLLLSFLTEGKTSLGVFFLFPWIEVSKSFDRTITEVSHFSIQGSQVQLFPCLMLQRLYLEFCIGLHGNSNLVICPSVAGEQLLECILDISEKKASPHETPENNEGELNFSSSEITHICLIFSTVLFYFPIYLNQSYILGFEQLILDKHNYNWMEQTNIVLRGHGSGYSEAWK